MAAPLAMATGVSLLDDLVPSAQTPKSAPSTGHQRAMATDSPMGMEKPMPPPQLAPLKRSVSFDQMKPGDKVLTPPMSACGHPNAGQELCYLCHQRSRRNVPVSFSDERRRREEEEDRLLQQYQYMKDAENVLSDQEMLLAKRHNLQKMAAFNLGVSEAQHHKKRQRETDYHKSYIFQKRPLTPPRFYKQNEYSTELSKQVETKDNVKSKVKSDEEFLERLEQVQLAEDLAIQREQYMKLKVEEQDKYKNALESQLRFKPLQLPPREPDTEVFGKNDMTNEKMAERRRRAYEMFRDQQDLVAQRKREHHIEDKLRALSPGMLLHEQCDKYNRCTQCKRVVKNCGESNVWSESRYIPGSRLMV